jgi:hypothetical protein
MYFSGYPCPPYNFIILDEGDSMTKDAQVFATHSWYGESGEVSIGERVEQPAY